MKDKENIKMTYDERKKQLTRVVTTEKETESTEWKIVLNEKGIKQIYDSLTQELQQSEDAKVSSSAKLSSIEKQLEDAKKIRLTKLQQSIKDALKILHKDAERDNLLQKATDEKAMISYLQNEINLKNKTLNDLKSKVTNIGLE